MSHMLGFETPEAGGPKARESWPPHDFERFVPSNLLAMRCGKRPRGGL